MIPNPTHKHTKLTNSLSVIPEQRSLCYTSIIKSNNEIQRILTTTRIKRNMLTYNHSHEQYELLKPQREKWLFVVLNMEMHYESTEKGPIK